MIGALSLWIQGFLVAVILAAMIILLFGITSLFNRKDTKTKSTSRLRDEVLHHEDVITSDNVFSDFLAPDHRHSHSSDSKHSSPAHDSL